LKDGIDIDQAALYLTSHVVALNTMVKMDIPVEQLLATSDLVVGAVVR
jgi:hypothetical protein